MQLELWPTKLCRSCNTVKPLTEFYRGKVGPKTATNGYRSRCKDCDKALAKAHYRQNGPKDPEKNREAQRRFHERNPGKNAEYGRKWREKDPDRALELARERGRKWRRLKPEGRVVSQLRRRTEMATMTPDDHEYVAILRSDPCSYCGGPSLPVDHIEPIFHGGSAGWENMTASCQRCNSSKSTDSLLSYLLRTARGPR